MLVLLLALLIGSNQREPLFLDTQHPKSHRHAVLEESNGAVYLYLTASGEPRPEKDIVVFSTGGFVTKPQAIAAAKNGETPPLYRQVASSEAVVKEPRGSEFTFRWTADGENVAVLRSSRPLAMILAGKARGFSRSLAVSCFYGAPWDQRLYENVFGR